MNIILNLSLIPIFKITGAAIATSMSYLVILILSTKKLTKFIKMPTPWKTWLKTIFAGVIFVIILFLVKILPGFDIWFKIIIGFILAGIIYTLLIWKLKVIDFKEIKKIIKRVL